MANSNDINIELEELQNIAFRHLMSWKKDQDSKFTIDEINSDIMTMIAKSINSKDPIKIIFNEDTLGFEFKSRLTDVLIKANIGFDVQLSMNGRITITPSPLKARYSFILTKEPDNKENEYFITGVIMGKDVEDK